MHGVELASSTDTRMLSVAAPAVPTTQVCPGRETTWMFTFPPVPGVTVTSAGFRDVQVTAVPVLLPNASRAAPAMNSDDRATEKRSAGGVIVKAAFGPVNPETETDLTGARPSTVAVTWFGPGTVPTVSMVAADPSRAVVAATGFTLPPPTEIVKLTVTPGIALPAASRTLTVSVPASDPTVAVVAGLATISISAGVGRSGSEVSRHPDVKTKTAAADLTADLTAGDI